MKKISSKAIKLLLAALFLAGSASAQVVTGGSGGGIPANSPLPLASSGPGPVFNVVNYGAVGDAQTSTQLGCNTHGNTLVDCASAAFNASTDVGKNFFCGAATATAFNTLTTISSVTDATHIVVSNTANFTGTCTGLWGTLAATETAVSAAVTAAKAAANAKFLAGNKGIFTASPTIYFPAGGYIFCTLLQNSVVNLSGSISGINIVGDGSGSTFWYAGSGTTACPATNNQVFGGFVNTGGSTTNTTIKGITFDGANNYNNNFQYSALALFGSGNLNDVTVERWGGNFGFGILLDGSWSGITVGAEVNQGVGIQCQTCSGEFRNSTSSNNGNSPNLVFNGVVGSNGGPGFRWYGGLIDECGNNLVGCTQLINSDDVWFIGMAGFGTSGGHCVSVDANSFLHWAGGICGTFGNDTNAGGPSIAAGGSLQASDLRMIGTGSGKCMTNSGSFNDNGGNSCENMYPIASGTSTGTTAVITVSNPSGVAVNTNCTIGDSLLVEGAGIAGYDGYFPFGITNVAATTITYTTQGSNLGVLGAAGSVYCRNLQSYSGNLPKALLNNPVPNTCYVIATPFAATTTALPACNFKTQSATNISYIKASSTTSTTCAAAPVITITDGTSSVTLTMTSGKAIWDSSVDASTGVGTTIFKPNGTISVTNTAGTCATPPTGVAISYNVSPILSN